MRCGLRERNDRFKTGESSQQERSHVNTLELTVRDHWNRGHEQSPQAEIGQDSAHGDLKGIDKRHLTLRVVQRPVEAEHFCRASFNLGEQRQLRQALNAIHQRGFQHRAVCYFTYRGLFCQKLSQEGEHCSGEAQADEQNCRQLK